VLIVDTLRADHLSSYGYGRPTSPTLDRLAREGVLFENAFSTSSYTLPSHASLLTGLYPFQHGVEWQTSKHPAALPLSNLPETLQTLGYRTGAFSANTFWFSREHGFGRGFHHFDEYFHSVEDAFMRTAYGRIVTRGLLQRIGTPDIPARRRAASINSALLSWIKRDRDAPFFVVANYMDVHDPYLPPQPYRSAFSAGPEPPGGILHWELNIPNRLSPEELQGEIDAYDGGIAYVDSQIGALVSLLEARNTDRDLLLIVTSDHGDEFYEHGGFLHGTHLYREVVHVPLIIWQPGRVPAKVRIETPVTNASVAATILRELGIDWHAAAAPPLQPLWQAPGPHDWPAALAELSHRPWTREGAPVRDGSLRALVKGTFHYIEHDARKPELYDWSVDPREAVNLATRPEMLRFLEDLGGHVRRLRAEAPPATAAQH
jgi:arylsulfatase A-like enzyme